MDNQKEIILPIKNRQSTLKFLLKIIVTLGYYKYFWFLKNANDIINLDKDQKSLYWSIVGSSFIADMFILITAFSGGEVSETIKFCQSLIKGALIAITLMVLKSIEKYSLNNYGVKIRHNIFAILFFSLIYLNFAINTFEERVKKNL